MRVVASDGNDGAIPHRRSARADGRVGVLLAAALSLGACAFPRESGTSCNGAFDEGMTPAVAQSVSDPVALAPDPASDMAMRPSAGEAVSRVAEAIRAEAGQQPGRGPVVLRVLVLSAGGQYGAFGAGFLTGWSENPATPRPAFDLVTGVSAGALLAPVAFAGSDFDPLLIPWRGLSERQVYRRRGPLALLRAPSVATADPLRALIGRQIGTDGLIAGLARRDATGARLLISAVDLESTRAQVFDLGALAASPLDPATKTDCLSAAMMASAAIPGLLPPQVIDGRLYADGGLRDQVFLSTLEDARALVSRETGRAVEVEARLIINGSLALPDGPIGAPDDSGGAVRDTLPDYLVRAGVILSDEILRNSVRRVVDFAASRPGWRLTGMVAREDPARLCPGAAALGTFDACTTRVLFDAGRAAGRRVPIDWLGPAALRALARSPGAGTE